MLLNVHRPITRVREIYEQAGLIGLLHSIKYVGKNVLIGALPGRVQTGLQLAGVRVGLVTPYHEHKRTDSRERWKWISDQLESDDGSALDIGCASGFFSARLAESGLFTIGIEQQSQRLHQARQLYGDRSQLAFVRTEVTPDTVASLPGVDVVLLLTVYHHWTRDFGREAAEGMLRLLADRSKKLFFEPPGHIDDSESFDKWQLSDESVDEDESIPEYYERLLRDILDDSVSITLLGTAQHRPTTPRTDPVFLIDCSRYEKPAHVATIRPTTDER